MYKITVCTTAYKPLKEGKNKEVKRMNDFMFALNGYQKTEKTLSKTLDRMMTWGGDTPHDEKYIPFRDWQYKHAIIKFYDRWSERETTELIGAYGIAQGYINYDTKISELKNNGKVKIDLSEAYDIRQGQFAKNIKGYYMLVEKITA